MVVFLLTRTFLPLHWLSEFKSRTDEKITVHITVRIIPVQENIRRKSAKSFGRVSCTGDIRQIYSSFSAARLRTGTGPIPDILPGSDQTMSAISRIIAIAQRVLRDVP